MQMEQLGGFKGRPLVVVNWKSWKSGNRHRRLRLCFQQDPRAANLGGRRNDEPDLRRSLIQAGLQRLWSDWGYRDSKLQG